MIFPRKFFHDEFQQFISSRLTLFRTHISAPLHGLKRYGVANQAIITRPFNLPGTISRAPNADRYFLLPLLIGCTAEIRHLIEHPLS